MSYHYNVKDTFPDDGLQQAYYEAFHLGTRCLGSECRIELTLNYPRTASFKRKTYEQQCAVYDQWIDDNLGHMFPRITNFRRAYEHCKDGTAHVHLDITYSIPNGIYHPYGITCDFVKPLLQGLPKRYGIKTFSIFKYNAIYERYRCPSILCQVRDAKDRIRALNWNAYLDKEQTQNS